MGKNRNILILVVLVTLAVASAQNITKILDGEPQLSTLNKLLSETGVAEEINNRKSITLLAPDNSVLNPILAKLGPKLSAEQLADILRYHILLQYFDIPELHQIINGTTQVTTLYQTTGRAEGTLGFVNITKTKGGSLEVSAPAADNSAHATIVKSVKQIPYNISIFELSTVIVPQGVLTETTPPAVAPAPSPLTAPSPAPALAPQLAPVLVPALSPVPLSAPVPSPASSPVPQAAPTPTPEAAPVPSAAPTPIPTLTPTPAASPVHTPTASPPAPPTEGPAPPNAHSPSSPSKSSAFHRTSALFIRLNLFVGLALPLFLQL